MACDYGSLDRPHPDGIAKTYCGRQIARVMGWQGADWLNRPERLQEERTDLLIKRLKLRPGWVVGDIGAGTGRLTREMARSVLPGGRVWAVDIQPQMIGFLKKMASEFKPGEIEIRQSSATGMSIPPDTLDVAVMVDVYHELEFPREALKSLVESVKPGGQVVFVEYRADDFTVPIKPMHTMSVAQVRKEAEFAGLIFERSDSSLPWQDVTVFRRPDKR